MMRIYTLNHKNKSHICQKRLSIPVEMEFVRKIRSYNYLQEDKMMLIVFCHLFVNNVSVSVFTYCHKKTDQERRLSQFC